MDLLDGLYVAFLLAINGFFVAAEFALVKVRISQIDALAAAGGWAAKLTSKALDRLDAYLSASQLGITVASLALGNAIHDKIEPGIIGLFHDLGFQVEKGSTSWLATLVPVVALCLVTFLHMAIGEQAPKNLAIRYPKALSLISAPPLVLFTYVFWPIIWLLNSASNLLLRVMGLGGANHVELAHTEEELRHILGESAAGGVLSRNERLMIENVLNLEEKTAQRVMVPRADIVYLSLARPLEENLRLARQSGHTRYPLCEDDLTHVVGMVHVKDLFRVSQASGRVDLRQMARKVPYVPPGLKLDKLLLEFQRDKVHMAMILDEDGERVVGMVFLENVLEELVGPIQDEFDKESPHVQDKGHGVYFVSGLCPIDEFAAECRLQVPETDAATVAGLVLERLGRMANPGDTILMDDRRITVTEAEPTRIRLVKVEPAGVV
jgi:CBS domain containing-hemolysin-like protein